MKARTHAARRRWARWRDGLRERPTAEFSYRVAVAVVGVIVLAVGIVAIPYPGPGWALVFVGLGILASEFAWAQRVLKWLKARYQIFVEWFKRQGILVKVAGFLFTTAVTVATLWLLGALDLVASWVGLDRPWLKSPIGL